MIPLSYRSPKTEVRPSPIHGRGLFAKAAIEKDEIVMIKGGHILSRAQVQELQATLGPVEIQIAEDFYIAPVAAEEREGAMLYSNHSCQANLGLRGEITFVAMQPIAAGEELTHDWAMTDDDDSRTACRCGAKNCRGVVTGKDWQLPAVQRQYGGYFSSYLLAKMNKLLALTLFACAATSLAQEAVMEEIVIDAPFDIRLQLPKDAHVQTLLDRLLLKEETQHALELQIANRDPLSTVLNLTRYIPIPMGSSAEGSAAFLGRDAGRNPLEPPKHNPLFEDASGTRVPH